MRIVRSWYGLHVVIMRSSYGHHAGYHYIAAADPPRQALGPAGWRRQGERAEKHTAVLCPLCCVGLCCVCCAVSAVLCWLYWVRCAVWLCCVRCVAAVPCPLSCIALARLGVGLRQGRPCLIPGADIGAPVQQDLDQSGVAVLSRHHEDCNAVLPAERRAQGVGFPAEGSAAGRVAGAKESATPKPPGGACRRSLTASTNSEPAACSAASTPARWPAASERQSVYA